jgi:hypothetical protein
MGGLEPEPGEEAVQMIGGIAAVFAVGGVRLLRLLRTAAWSDEH